MTGVFASTAAVGAILGIGGLAAYIKGVYNPKTDAELIDKVIKEKDNSEIIIKLLECRFPKKRNEIKEEYEKMNGSGHNFIEDINNYLPSNISGHFNNLMVQTKDIKPRTEYINSLLKFNDLDKYLEGEFNEDRDSNLIYQIVENNDNPLIIVRLLNHRNEEQRKKINNSFKKINIAPEKNLLSFIIDFMPNHEEINYIHSLLDNIK